MGARLFHWIGVGVISGSSGNMCLCDALGARLQSAEEERGRLVTAVMAGVGGL